MSDFLKAIKSGAQVSSVAHVLAKGANNEGRGYLVTLFDTANMTERDYYLPFSTETVELLGL